MKICFLAPANNYHTQKWCKYFVGQGHEVSVLSLTDGNIAGAKVYWLNASTKATQSDFHKLKYLFQFSRVKKIINETKPDIINAHYASSYGTLAAISGLNNYIVSVWGSDVYEFPRKSFLHRMLLKYSLNSAKCIFSTSKAMAKETRKYTSKKIYITPFGVDMTLFNPDKRTRTGDNEFVIGTVKRLEPKYGVDYFLRAVKIVREKRPDINLKVRIAGKGTHGLEYKKLAKSLRIDDIVIWLGFISQSEAAKEWANMDCGIIFSESESFGVSAVEAQAAGTPVIISDIPGLMEATKPNVTSVVVPRKNEKLLADKIIELYDCPRVRFDMAQKGRYFVRHTYELNQCFRSIIELYQYVLRKG